MQEVCTKRSLAMSTKNGNYFSTEAEMHTPANSDPCSSSWHGWALPGAATSRKCRNTRHFPCQLGYFRQSTQVLVADVPATMSIHLSSAV